MTTNFEQFFLNDTAAVEIDLPTGEPLINNGQRVVVHIYGPGTEQYVQARKAADSEAARRAIALIGKPGKKKSQAADDDADAKFLAAITQRIDNFDYPGGPLAVYLEPRLVYIGNQVRNHLNDLGNFYGATSPS